MQFTRDPDMLTVTGKAIPLLTPQFVNRIVVCLPQSNRPFTVNLAKN